LFTDKTPDYQLKKDIPPLYNLPIHTILLTMSLTITHYCDILLNMSQINAHFNLLSPTQKMPSAFFARPPGNRQQAHPNKMRPVKGRWSENAAR